MRRATKWMWVRFHAHTNSLKSPRLSSLAVCLEERTSFCYKAKVTLEKCTVKESARERERAPNTKTLLSLHIITWPKKSQSSCQEQETIVCVRIRGCINIVVGVHNSMFSEWIRGQESCCTRLTYTLMYCGVQKFEKEVNILFSFFVPKKIHKNKHTHTIYSLLCSSRHKTLL